MYSQAWQDEFVDLILDKPATGYFVDVGAGYDLVVDGKVNSNSLMFEERGWMGLAIDADTKRMLGRKCYVQEAMIGDGTNGTVELEAVLRDFHVAKHIDYLSLDIEGVELLALKSFIKGGYDCKVITVEHNLYTCNPGVEDLKRDIFMTLASAGYLRLVDNVGDRASPAGLKVGGAFEDWYIHPKYVSWESANSKLKALK